MKSSNFFYNKKVLITGAAGSIGSALAQRISQCHPKKLFLLDNNETGVFDVSQTVKDSKMIVCSIRDEKRIEAIFQQYKPDIVFHAAAYKHVVPMEQWSYEAVRTNVGGTLNVISASVKSGVQKFIFISTDKAVEPTSILGLTKSYGEKFCNVLNGWTKTKFISVRFGNVMASRGSVVPVFQKQIEKDQPVTVTHKKMERYFLGIYEAIDLVLKAAELGKGGEVFVLDMGQPILISDLAKMMIKLSGKPIEIVYTHPGKGEKMDEKLMTKEEADRCEKVDNLFVIRNG